MVYRRHELLDGINDDLGSRISGLQRAETPRNEARTDPGVAGGLDINTHVANHHSFGTGQAAFLDDGLDADGIGLQLGQGAASPHTAEKPVEPVTSELRSDRHMGLVRENEKIETAAEVLQRLADAGVYARSFRLVLEIVAPELAAQLFDALGFAGINLRESREQIGEAVAHRTEYLMIIEGRQTDQLSNVVRGEDDIAGRVHEGAVQVEDQRTVRAFGTVRFHLSPRLPVLSKHSPLKPKDAKKRHPVYTNQSALHENVIRGMEAAALNPLKRPGRRSRR